MFVYVRVCEFLWVHLNPGVCYSLSPRRCTKTSCVDACKIPSHGSVFSVSLHYHHSGAYVHMQRSGSGTQALPYLHALK